MKYVPDFASARTVLEAALAFAAAGIPVFPCTSTKAPTCPTGFKAATKDPVAVGELWRAYPGPLIGVPTGRVAGFDVLDLDVTRGAGNRWWYDNQQRLPTTRAHRTRSGGAHLLFQHAPGLRCSTGKIAAGVDTRADGGYVIWWPAAGWSVLCDAAVTPWPSWLLDVLRPPTRECPNVTAIVPDDYAITALLRTVASAQEGERNKLLFWAACRMAERVRSKLLDLDKALAMLEQAAARAGLPAIEAHRTALSGLRTVGED